MNEAIAKTITIEEAGRELGLSRNSAYLAARRGEIPTLKFGRRLVVPRVAFEAMLAAPAQKKTAEAR